MSVSVARFGPASRRAFAGLVVLSLALAAAPWWAGRPVLELLTLVFAYVVLAQLWNMLAGYGGMVSAGQHAYVGIGGYVLFMFAVGIEMSLFGDSVKLALPQINPLAAVLAAGAVGGLIAVPIAFLLFRLRGAYFAIGAWVVADVARQLFFQLESLGGGSGFSLPAAVVRATWGAEFIKDLFGARAPTARAILNYWLSFGLMLAVLAALYAVLLSRRGLWLAAIRDNERAARAVGIDRERIKYFLYVFAAAATAMAGALIFLNKLRISPDTAFSLQDWTAFVIFIVVIGGLGTLEGPIIGVVIYFALREFLADYASWYLIVLGCSAVAFMLYAPQGVWGIIRKRFGIELFPVSHRLELPAAARPPPSEARAGAL